MGAMIPEFYFLSSPGLFNNVAEVNKIWTSEVADYLRYKAPFESSGFSDVLTAQPEKGFISYY